MPKAFVENVYHDSGHGDGTPVLQINPAWVVTFVRWSNRSLGSKEELNYQGNKGTPEDFFLTEDTLVVDKDCIGISITNSKSSITPAAQVILKSGSYDYLTAVAPGDFMFINTVDSEVEAAEIVKNAKGRKPINKYHDGFKGIFKIKSVRKVYNMDKRSGIKTQNFLIQGYAFSELNNTVYFNPHLINRAELKNDFLFLSNLSDSWRAVLAKKDGNNVQTLVAELFKLFVGVGLASKAKYVKGNKKSLKTPNTHFYIPQTVGKLLGENNAKAVKDIYNLLFGKQTYEAGQVQNPEDGLNPSQFILSPEVDMPRLKVPKNTTQYCEGTSFVQAEYWQQVTAYSIMQQYLNSPINEMYATFRVDSDGYIMPTLVMRQIPFSSEEYDSSSATKFLNLPRWSVPKEYLYQMNLGREDAARFNFVQIFGRLNNAYDPSSGIGTQIQQGNYSMDEADIKKNGLRVYTVTSNFDNAFGKNKNSYRSVIWSKLIADCLIGGHLKMNGSVTIPGVAKPIAVGDNCQIGNMVFHIESVTHNCTISPEGEKEFVTTLELSNGVNDSQNQKKQNYIGMKNTNTFESETSDANVFDMSTTADGFGESQLKNTSFGPQDLIATEKSRLKRQREQKVASRKNKKNQKSRTKR
jgi:hypothetical protein